MAARKKPVDSGMPAVDANQLLTLINAIPQACLIFRNDRVLFANEQCVSLLEFDTLENLMELPSVRGLFDDGKKVVSELKENGGGDKHTVSNSAMIRLADDEGPVRMVDCTASQIDWHGAAATMLLMTSVNDTGELLDAAISGELFSQVFNLSPNVIMMIRMSDATYYQVNSACLHMLGVSRDDLIGQSVHELDVWVDPSFYSWMFSQLRSHSVLRDVPAKIISRGGLIREMILVAETLNTADGQMLILIGRDISEEVEREHELARSRDEAEVANRTKSEFLANMSHELRTPLNAILGFSEIISHEHLGPIGLPRYKEYASDIYNSGIHLLDIINDILDLSKVESGRLELAIQSVDVSEVATECIRYISGRAEEAEVVLRTRLEEILPATLDRRLTKQIIINLLSNAVKFTPRGGTIDLFVERTSSGGGRITVADTGIGMSAEDIEVALTPFGQVDSHMGRMYEGSGLGLPLVSAFCEKQGMKLEINSSPGQGTQVSITLPASLMCEADDLYGDTMLI